MTPFVIPFFISHQGCPHQCVFCNQHAISGAGSTAVSGAMVAQEIDRCLAWPRRSDRPVQVAFYGGSFTGLAWDRQAELLGAVAPYLAKGLVQGIRLSTRPDFIEPAMVHRLKAGGVTLIELGVQSMDDAVLQQSGRGHTVADVEQAFAVLKAGRMAVGGQLMVGLPGDSRYRACGSARRLAALKPDLVRIYPTLVMQDSPLADLYGQGKYRPWSLALCTAVCAVMKKIFDHDSIPVARMGLQSCERLERDLVAGPYHPAFGELVQGRLYFKMMRRTIIGARRKHGAGRLMLELAQRDRSLFVGLNGVNRALYQRRGLLDRVTVVFSAEQPRFSARIAGLVG